MGLTRLDDFLSRHKRIALDTNVFIYQLEANPRYSGLTDRIFAWIERPGHSAVTAAITMTEVLVKPYQSAAEQRANEFYGLLTAYPNLDWIALDLDIAGSAARIRATHRLRTPDALQAACAIHAHATGMITNDPVFGRVAAFETLLLNDVL